LGNFCRKFNDIEARGVPRLAAAHMKDFCLDSTPDSCANGVQNRLSPAHSSGSA
jgi:hypothetical protein